MTSNPFVSVIIPNYNHAAFLRERIDSVLNQTYQHFEVLILDDNSTDKSKDVIETYRSHQKVSRIIYNEKNVGNTFLQWQKGIEQASGEWIWIAESDDWCETNFLETLINGIDNDTVLAIAQSVVIFPGEEIRWKTHTSFLNKIYTGIDFIKDKMLLDNFGIPNASMCIFKKETYAKVDKEFTTYRFCGDWLYWIQVALQGKVYVSGKYLNYFRKHDKDVSGSSYKNGLHYTEHFRLLNWLEEKKIITTEEKRTTLIERFRMFLKDQRLEATTGAEIRNTFKKLIAGNFYRILLRHKTVQFLKSV